MVFPIVANTPRHTNFGEACGQFRWGHPNDDAAIPHSRSFPRLLHFWSKIRRRGNGKAQWSDKVTMYQGARQKLLGTSTKADASGALSPKWSYASVLVIKSPIQFHMVSSIAHVKSCADLKIVFWWLLHLSCSELQPLGRVLEGFHKVLSAWGITMNAPEDALLNGTILLCNIMQYYANMKRWKENTGSRWLDAAPCHLDRLTWCVPSAAASSNIQPAPAHGFTIFTAPSGWNSDLRTKWSTSGSSSTTAGSTSTLFHGSLLWPGAKKRSRKNETRRRKDSWTLGKLVDKLITIYYPMIITGIHGGYSWISL